MPFLFILAVTLLIHMNWAPLVFSSMAKAVVSPTELQVCGWFRI